jgi:hypothetical protein
LRTIRVVIFLFGVQILSACGGAVPPDPRREKYEHDKTACEQGSQDEAARKSCMTYRGWPNGKFR